MTQIVHEVAGTVVLSPGVNSMTVLALDSGSASAAALAAQVAAERAADAAESATSTISPIPDNQLINDGQGLYVSRPTLETAQW